MKTFSPVCRVLLLTVALAFVGSVNAIEGVISDLMGCYLATGTKATTAATCIGVEQRDNSPKTFNMGEQSPAISGMTGGSNTKLFKRITKETYAKFYVKCVGSSIGATTGSTYTLSYSLDGSTNKVVGSTYTATSNPFVLVEGLEDGEHTMTITCTENAKSISSTLPASDTVETDPIIMNWIVDTSGNPSAYMESSPSSYTNADSYTLAFSTSTASSSYISSFAWECYVEHPDGNTGWKSCGEAKQSTSELVDWSGKSDGSYSFKARVVITYIPCNAHYSTKTCSDLGSKTATKGTSWVVDRVAPEVVVTSSPAAKSQYTEGKKAKFEFACKAGEVSCSYYCSFDGMNTDNANDSDREKGFFSCTSPLKLTVKNTTTHSFKAYAMDAAGNKSPDTLLYMFYADGTPPAVEFTMMDDSISSDTMALASGDSGKYYSFNNDLNVAGSNLLTNTGALAALDECNGNFDDRNRGSACIAGSVIQFTDSNGDSTTRGTLSPMNSSSFHTVLQFPFNPSKAVYELTDTYGAILAMKKVNDKYYYNVLDTTNADFGRLNYRCVHTEMAD